MAKLSNAARTYLSSRRRLRRKSLAGILVALCAAATLSIATASPASAWETPEFPTLALGSEGRVVKAWQLLLHQYGYFGHSATGHFDAATLQSTDAWQIAEFGSTTGKVTPDRWQRIVGNVGPWEYSWRVAALKELLIKKSVFRWDGNFTWYISSPDPNNPWWQYSWDEWNALNLVRDHRGVARNGGIAELEDWRYLTWHYELANVSGAYIAGETVLCNPGTPNGWGASMPIGFVSHIATDYYYQAQFITGVGGSWGRITESDYSLEHGGPFGPHVSHNWGMDIDLRATANNAGGWPSCMPVAFYQDWNYDLFRSRVFLQNAYGVAAESAFGWINTQHLQLVFHNQPNLINEGLAIYESGHDSHYHLRYCTYANPGYTRRCPWA